MLLCFRVRAFLFSEIRLQPTALSKYITGMSWCYGHISNFVIDDRNFKNSCRYSQEVLTSYRLCFTKLRAMQVLFFTSFCCFDGLRNICTAPQIREYQWIQKNFYCTFARYKIFLQNLLHDEFYSLQNILLYKVFSMQNLLLWKVSQNEDLIFYRVKFYSL